MTFLTVKIGCSIFVGIFWYALQPECFRVIFPKCFLLITSQANKRLFRCRKKLLCCKRFRYRLFLKVIRVLNGRKCFHESFGKVFLLTKINIYVAVLGDDTISFVTYMYLLSNEGFMWINILQC